MTLPLSAQTTDPNQFPFTHLEADAAGDVSLVRFSTSSDISFFNFLIRLCFAA